MKKHVFYTELAYILGIVILALGTGLMEAPDFGMSMVVAPAYILHLRVSEYLPFFSFGMAEYVFQGVLLIILAAVMRGFRLSYLFSFVTAVIYGLTLDGIMYFTTRIPCEGIVIRIVLYALGMVVCSVGVALFFHTYISPEAYELFVSEVSGKTGIEIHKFKTGYDIVSCIVGVILSFIFFGFGHFEGVKWGTVVTALVNGTIISFCSKFLEKNFEFRDRLPWRDFFTGRKD